MCPAEPAASPAPCLASCLHGVLLEALVQEAQAQDGASGGSPAGGDEEMRDAGAGGGTAGSRRARAAVGALTPAQQDQVVERMLAGADLQLGLANACVEVGAGCPGEPCAARQRDAAAGPLPGLLLPRAGALGLPHACMP